MVTTDELNRMVSDLMKEIAQLKIKIDKLEKEVETIKRQGAIAS